MHNKRTIPVALDHVGIATDELDRVIRQFRDLGFTVTKKQPLLGVSESGETQLLGQESAHIMFANSYIELTGLTGEVSGNHLEPFLARYHGIHILALRADDLEEEKRRYQQQGLTPSSTQFAKREIFYGEGGEAQFHWCQFREDLGVGLVCLVEHLTPNIVFSSEIAVHNNKAQELVAVELQYAKDSTIDRLCALQTPHEEGESRSVGVLHARQSSTGIEKIAGMTIAVESVDSLSAYFEDRRVEFTSDGVSISTSAGGTLIEFLDFT